MTSRLCAAQPLKYSGILDLDRRVREFDSHPFLRESGPTSLEWGSHVRMQRLAITMFKEIGTSKFYCCFDFCEFNPNQVSLYIHRNFFARALLDFPTNPLRSPFAPSFLAAYRSATQLLKTLRENFDAFSYLFIRLWPIWAHALAASVSTRLFCIWRSMSRKCTGDRWVRRLKWSFNNSGFFGVYRIGNGHYALREGDGAPRCQTGSCTSRYVNGIPLLKSHFVAYTIAYS